MNELRDALAGLPREIEPSRDLWPAIAARIVAHERAAPLRRWWPLGAGLAAAVAVTAVAVVLKVQPGVPERPTVVAGEAAGSIVVPLDPGLQLAGESILDALSEPGSGTLSPEAVELVRENLLIIDQALREIARALELDPDNPRLQRQLLDAYYGQARVVDHLMRLSADPAMRTDI